jgi:hypothetical protein
MTLYVVSAVRTNADGNVEFLKWAPYTGDETHATGEQEVVPISAVVASIDDGDIIDTLFPSEGRPVLGGKLLLKPLADGHVTVEIEVRDGPVRTIKDLPSF